MELQKIFSTYNLNSNRPYIRGSQPFWYHGALKCPKKIPRELVFFFSIQLEVVCNFYRVVIYIVINHFVRHLELICQNILSISVHEL